jgi:putative ABC transport system ATP-binding protein
MNPCVILSNVSRSYATDGGSTVLHHISMHVLPGELVLVLGPSGSGKTTLLQIMGGLLAPSTGDCCLFGRRWDQIPEAERQSWRARRIGFVFQSFRLISSLTALENVMLASVFAGAGPREAQHAALEALEVVQLRDKADRIPSTLSHGEQQRVAVARAIVNHAPLLLADEPTASLEGSQGLALIGLVRDRVRAEGSSAVIASHDTRLINLADRVFHLRDGALIASARCA